MGHVDPQVEAGNFTRIHNAILEAIVSTPFTAREQRVILWVLRHSYGFNKKTAPLDVKTLAITLGIYPNQVKAALLSLIEAGVLLVKNDTVGINKYVDRWTYKTATNQKQNSTKTKTTQQQLVANAPENTSNDAPLQTPKERKKEISIDPPLPPEENSEKRAGEIESLPDPPKTRRPDRAWRDLLASVDFFPGEVDFLADEFLGVNVPDGLAAVHPFKRPGLEAWLKHPRVARELAHQWATSQGWARNLFGAAKAYLENPARFKDKEPAAGQATATAVAKQQTSRFPGKPWAAEWTPARQGTARDRDWLETLATGLVKRGAPIEVLDEALRLYDAGGVEPAMDYLHDLRKASHVG